MRKFLLMITSFLIVLAGCGAKTPYQQFKNEVNPLATTNSLAMTVSSTISGTDSDLDGTAFEIKYVFDEKNDLISITIDNVVTYITEDTMYINIFSKWVKQSFDVDNFSEIKEAQAFKTAIKNLPDGDQQLAENLTGYEVVDNAIAGNTLNDLVTSPDANKYTIHGLESILDIDTTDGLKITLTTDEHGTTSLTFAEAEPLELPADAENALSLDGAADSLAGLSS